MFWPLMVMPPTPAAPVRNTRGRVGLRNADPRRAAATFARPGARRGAARGSTAHPRTPRARSARRAAGLGAPLPGAPEQDAVTFSVSRSGAGCRDRLRRPRPGSACLTAYRAPPRLPRGAGRAEATPRESSVRREIRTWSASEAGVGRAHVGDQGRDHEGAASSLAGSSARAASVAPESGPRGRSRGQVEPARRGEELRCLDG